jgi:hypothetical protein
MTSHSRKLCFLQNGELPQIGKCAEVYHRGWAQNDVHQTFEKEKEQIENLILRIIEVIGKMYKKERP